MTLKHNICIKFERVSVRELCFFVGLRDEADAFFTCVGLGVLIVNTAASYGILIEYEQLGNLSEHAPDKPA